MYSWDILCYLLLPQMFYLTLPCKILVRSSRSEDTVETTLNAGMILCVCVLLLFFMFKILMDHDYCMTM